MRGTKCFNTALNIDKRHTLSLAQRLKIERQICIWSSFQLINNFHTNNQLRTMKIQPRDLAYLVDDPGLELKVARDLYIREFKRIENNPFQKK